MRRQWRWAIAGLGLAMLSACASGPVKRVSEPTAGIQELEVKADGDWSVQVRLQNFSSVPMRFDEVSLEVKVGDQTAGTLRATPGLTVGPESADIATVAFSPSSAARIVVADALAERRTLKYELKGQVVAAPKDGRPRDYDIKRNSALSPVPGRPGVMR